MRRRGLLLFSGGIDSTLSVVIRKKKIGQKQPTMAGLKRTINAGSTFCGAQPFVMERARDGKVAASPGGAGWEKLGFALCHESGATPRCGGHMSDLWNGKAG